MTQSERAPPAPPPNEIVSCYDAAELIESLGDRVQATNLLSEVVFRFGDTPFGPQAETKWKALRETK